MIRAWRLVLLAVLSLFLDPAWSSTVYPDGRVYVDWIENGARFVDGPSGSGTFTGRDFFKGSAGPGGATVAEKYTQTIGGRQVAVTATRVISSAAIAEAIVGVGAAGWAGWQVGSAIADIFGLGDPRGGYGLVPTANGWIIDPGIPVRSRTGILYQLSCKGENRTFGSVADAVGCALSAANEGINCSQSPCLYPAGAQTETEATVSVGAMWCVHGQCGSVIQNAIVVQKVAGTIEDCPEHTDPNNPAWSHPDGSPPRADGRCSGGQPRVATPAEAKAAAKDGVEKSDRGPEAAQDAAARGASTQASGERNMSGETEVHGTPQTSTKTNPDGSTTTTVKTPSTTYEYNGPEVKYTPKETVKVTTCTVDGVCTVTEDGTSIGGTVTDPCEKDPTRIGCIKTGDLPEDKPAWQTKDIPFQIEDLGLPAACPPPLTVSLAGRQVVFAWDTVCGWAPFVRAVLLAITALSVSLFLVREVKV